MPAQDDKTSEILKKVRRVEIRSRRMVNDVLTGAYHSAFKGAGLNFTEVREYQPGDDVRSIDWNVTARMDKPFLKLYEEERELTVMLLVDLSASGDFGSVPQSKRELAAELACVLAFSATRNNDKVGLMLFTDGLEHYLPPRKGRQHALRLIRDVLYFQPKGLGTGLGNALRTLNHLQKRRAVCFLISDFISREGTDWERLLRVTAQRHDLTCVELHDPREAVLPNVGMIDLEDAETGEWVRLNTGNAEVRERYAILNRERREALQQVLRRSGVDSFTVTTGQEYERILRKFFEQRRRSRR